MSNFSINIGTVREIENPNSDEGYGGLRIKVSLYQDECDNKFIKVEELPWAFPLLPKVFQSVPKVGEAVLVFTSDAGDKFGGQRYFIGPIISQPQYMAYSSKDNATTLMQQSKRTPLENFENSDLTAGSFPQASDVAMVGRGQEDIILRYDNNASEVAIRSGIRVEPSTYENPNMIGNIIFNGTDPAYIQLKYKKGIATGAGHEANSVINMVANRINIMSNSDDAIAYNLGDKDTLVSEAKMDEVMDNLHQVPMGDKLVELLEVMKGAIMHHVHPWAGMEQCGDWSGFITQLSSYDIKSILSKYVRIS